MWRNIWKNRVEFYPACSIFFWYTVGSFLSSLRVQNRPGIVALGLITIPSIFLITIAFIKTYRELPPGD